MFIVCSVSYLERLAERWHQDVVGLRAKVSGRVSGLFGPTSTYGIQKHNFMVAMVSLVLTRTPSSALPLPSVAAVRDMDALGLTKLGYIFQGLANGLELTAVQSMSALAQQYKSLPLCARDVLLSTGGLTKRGKRSALHQAPKGSQYALLYPYRKWW